MTTKKSLNIIMVLTLLVVGFTVALEAGNKAAKYDFDLKDANGKQYTLSSFADSKAVAVIYVATRCPVSNAYNERMEKLYQQFKAKGISFVGVNSNVLEDVEEMKEHAAKNRLSFPIVKDLNNIVADRYEASVTPEVYLLNKKKELLYHGRIDDSSRLGNVSSKDLFNALTEVVNGKTVSVKKTKAFGCSVKRVKVKRVKKDTK